MLPALRVLSEPPPAPSRASGLRIAAPYLGLATYAEADARLFFGREADVRASLEKLEQDRMVVVVGEPGSGRTSLVRAGLVDGARERLRGSLHAELSVLYLDLGDEALDPYDALVEQLTRWQAPLRSSTTQRDTGDDTEDELPNTAGSQDLTRAELKQLLLGSQSGLCEASTRLGGGNRPLLIIVDGLDTPAQGDSADTRHLLNLLIHTAARRETLLHVVLTATQQGWHWAQQQVEEHEFVRRCAWFLKAPSKTDLLRMIAGPAALSGVEMDEALSRKLLADMRRSPVPLGRFAHALQRTWSAWRVRDPEDRPASPSVLDYDSIGGLERAFELHAESLFDAQNAREREVSALLLTRLCNGAQPLRFSVTTTSSDSSSSAPPSAALGTWTLRSAMSSAPRELFERAVLPWLQLGLVRVSAAESAAEVEASEGPATLAPDAELLAPNSRVRLAELGAEKAWPRLGLWVHAERTRQTQYRRWSRFVDADSQTGAPEVVLRGELLRQATLFWSVHYSRLQAEGALNPSEVNDSVDPVQRLIQNSEKHNAAHDEAREALARARKTLRNTDLLLHRSTRRRDVALAGMLVLGTALIVLGVSRWHAHTDYQSLLRASQDTSEEKRLLDEQHTRVRQQNQVQQQQLDTLRGQNVRLNAQVASLAERQREQDVQRSALENDKAELEKSVGMLRRHTLKLDEQLASKSQELQAIATQRETLSNALTLTEARVAGLAQSKSALDAELQECRELHREALRGREAARADLAREHALAEQRKMAHDGFAGPAAASVPSKTP